MAYISLQEYTFRHRSVCGTPAESGQEYLTGRKGYIDSHKTQYARLSRRKELGGKTGVLVGPDLPSAGGGAEADVRSPHRGNCLRQRRNI